MGRGGGAIGTPGRTACGAAGGMLGPAGGAGAGERGRGEGTGGALGSGWRGPERTWPGRVPPEGIGRVGGESGRSGGSGVNGGAGGCAGVDEVGAVAPARGPTGGWIGAPRPSMGGRSGFVRGLSSAGASGFFCSAGGAPGALGSADAAAGGRSGGATGGGAIGAPRFGGSTGFASPAALALTGAELSAGVGVSAGFAAFAFSITEVSPPK